MFCTNNILFNIPKEIYDSKTINLNKTVTDGKLKVDIKDLKIVTCHLGQGSSICAVKNGKSIDTSMGLSPLGGIPMVTRSGDMDPSVLTYIMKKDNLAADEMESILNKESGVSGISGLAPDFRIIEQAANEGNERAQIAMSSFKYAIASYIAKYAVAMNGIDYIIFTGGVGENQILIGFPHPSGANVNRVKQLEENKENMISFIKNKF